VSRRPPAQAPATAQAPFSDLARDAQRQADLHLFKRASDGAELSALDRSRLAQLAAGHDDPVDAATLRVAELAAAGKPIPAKLQKEAREAALLRLADHLWPSVEAAAAELGASSASVRNWCAEAGIEHQRIAIPRAALYRWLYRRELERRTRQGGDLDAELKELRVARERRTLQAEATARAHLAADLVADYLRDALLTRGPTELVDLARRHSDQRAAEDAVETWLASTLRRVAQASREATP